MQRVGLAYTTCSSWGWHACSACNAPPRLAAVPLIYVGYGDSITHGWCGRGDSYVGQLAALTTHLALRPINSALWNDPHGQLEGTAPNKVRRRTPLRPHTATPDLTPRIPHI